MNITDEKNKKEISNYFFEPNFQHLESQYVPTAEEFVRFQSQLSGYPKSHGHIYFMNESNEKRTSSRKKRFTFKKAKHDPRRIAFMWYYGRLPSKRKLTVEMTCGDNNCINPIHMKERLEKGIHYKVLIVYSFKKKGNQKDHKVYYSRGIIRCGLRF